MTSENGNLNVWVEKQGQQQLVLPEGYVAFYPVSTGRHTLQWVNFANPEKSTFILVENMSPEVIKLNWRTIIEERTDKHVPNNTYHQLKDFNNDDDATVSMHEAASILGFAHVSSINYHVRAGRLDAIKVEGVRGRRITMASIEDFSDERSVTPTQKINEPTMSKQEVLDAIGKAHISSVNYYLRTGKLVAVKVAGHRARRITSSSVQNLLKELERKSSV